MTVAGSVALATKLAGLVDSKLGEDIVVMDMRELVSYTDYLVICTARSERQLGAIADEVRVRLKNENGMLPGRTEGGGGSGWAVLDYLDCVLHVFTADARERFRLEELWREAPLLEIAPRLVEAVE